jgi:hypothetical protein
MFASFIALGGLFAFYFTGVFHLQWQALDLSSSPVEQEPLKPQSTVIHLHSGTRITAVAEEFNPHPTLLSSPTIPPLPENTQNSRPPPEPTPSTTAIDFTDPFNITRNVFYGGIFQYTTN